MQQVARISDVHLETVRQLMTMIENAGQKSAYRSSLSAGGP